MVRDRAEYERLYKWSIDDPQDFWGNMAQDYFWAKKVGGGKVEVGGRLQMHWGAGGRVRAGTVNALGTMGREVASP